MIDFKTAYVIIGINVQNGLQNPMAITFDESEAFVVVKRLNAEYREKQVHSVHLVEVHDFNKIGNRAYVVSKADHFVFPVVIGSDYDWARNVADDIERNTQYGSTIEYLPILIK